MKVYLSMCETCLPPTTFKVDGAANRTTVVVYILCREAFSIVWRQRVSNPSKKLQT
jgi:hypothetical protein